MKALLLAAMILLTGCGGRYYAGIGVGKNGVNPSNDWVGSGSMACTLEAGYIWRKEHHDVDIGWHHYSHCSLGKPFNNDPEDTLDSVTVNYRRYLTRQSGN